MADAPRALRRPAGNYSWWGSLIHNKRDLTGQLYIRNRYYDPAAGRFTQEDPIGLAGGINLYGFAAGDPVSYSDPYGLCPPIKDCLANLYYSRYSLGDIWHALGHAQRANLSAHDRQVLFTIYRTIRHVNRLVAEREQAGIYDAAQVNAFRHQFGACTLTRSLGAAEARAITNAHELKARSKSSVEAADSQADVQNNATGIVAGSDPVNTGESCETLSDRNIQEGNYASPTP